MKTIYCLYEMSGTFADQYRQLGYNVEAVDIQLGRNIFEFDYKKDANVVGVISHPPCTEFANSGSRWWAWKLKHRPDLLPEAVRQVEMVLTIVAYHKPQFWFIENPIGRIRQYIDIGNPRLIFDPFEYAGWLDPPWPDVYTKRTCLWGNFNMPEKKPVDVNPLSRMHTAAPGPERKNLRSKTPMGFARAFVAANQP